jgi:hypothetical protein
MRASIKAWIAETCLPNVRQPIAIDVREEPWPVERADAVLCINMVHISPWTATVAMMRGASGLLGEGSVLVLYGPYKRFGRHTAPSNQAFDEQLRATNSEWGVRDLEAVADAARAHSLELRDVVDMPANNLTLIFRRVLAA